MAASPSKTRNIDKGGAQIKPKDRVGFDTVRRCPPGVGELREGESVKEVVTDCVSYCSSVNAFCGTALA